MHPALQIGLKAEPVPEQTVRRVLYGLKQLDAVVKVDLNPEGKTQLLDDATEEPVRLRANKNDIKGW